MEITHNRTVRIIAALLIVATITQSIYTALYIAKAEVPRQLLWGTEGILFSLLAALAGAAMVRSKALTLAFAAIAFGAVLNIVQVGVGLTLFGPFGEAADAVPALAPAAGATVRMPPSNSTSARSAQASSTAARSWSSVSSARA